MLAVLLALAAAGCSETIRGGAAADAPQIRDVSVAGNDGVDDDDIVDGLANRGPDGIFFRTYRRLDRLALEQDISRIESYYQRRGFFKAKVVGTDIQPDGKNRVKVTFRVEEGKPTRVAGLSLVGLSKGLKNSKKLAEEREKIQQGEIFRYDRYVAFKEFIQGWMAHRGYPHGKVEGKVDVDRDAHTADIRLTLDRGPYARFGKTTVQGLNRVPESAVRNRLAYEPGEGFRPAKMALTQGRLYQLGLFSAVRMDYAKAGRPRITDIDVSLTEARRHELRLGGGVAVSGGFDPSQVRIEVRGRIAYLMRQVFDPLSTLRLEARPGWEWLQQAGTNSPVGEATATVERPDLILPRMVSQVTVGYDQSQFESYVSRGPLLRLGVTRPWLDDRLQVGVAWRFRYLDFPTIDPALAANENEVDAMGNPDLSDDLGEEIGLSSPYRLGALEQNISYDWRNDPLDPRYGIYAAIAVSEGAAAFGGAFPFLRATGDLRGYLPVGRRIVLAGRTFYGRTFATDVLPVTERFYDGGATGHRGFSYRQLSPIEPGQEQVTEEDMIVNQPARAAIGGDQHLLGSAEVRVRVAKIKEFPLGVVLFTDAGDVVCTDDSLEACENRLDLSNLHWAAGVGLRYNPVIAIRLDVGYRLNRYEEGEPAAGQRFAFHFSLGQAF